MFIYTLYTHFIYTLYTVILIIVIYLYTDIMGTRLNPLLPKSDRTFSTLTELNPLCQDFFHFFSKLTRLNPHILPIFPPTTIYFIYIHSHYKNLSNLLSVRCLLSSALPKSLLLR
ncbi:hypothetical protein NERG_00892 [Nematocida ausubeli]|uniref:Uncharacterized protein n=1 Tax=Nematocida ausubeli (strain ATCC PRA-371 / ERTm2) TaxID=1913371 RepID=H8ZBE3_NEMA1|nr:hypothetical protein NERG_00892 [Nematocida ausubeli]